MIVVPLDPDSGFYKQLSESVAEVSIGEKRGLTRPVHKRARP